MKRYLAYARDVRAGKILACANLKKAVDRFYRDLAASKKGGPWIFDEAEADNIIDFIECLVQFEEPFTGQTIALEPWECFFLGQLYGWRNRKTGRRRFRKAMLFMGRKQGKTILASGLTLYELLTKDGIEAYSLATKQEIANKTLRNLKAFIARDDELASLLKVYSYSIVNQDNFSTFKPLSRDSQLDGLNPAYCIIDELAAQKDASAYNTLTSGMGTRSEALTVIISTAGYGVSNPMIEEYEYAVKVLDDTIKDDSYLIAIYEYDKGDRWDDTTKLLKSCPNLGVSVPLTYFKDQLGQAQSIPKSAAEYKVKYCNLWQADLDTWIKPEVWARCAVPAPAVDLAACPCVIALDFSSIWDWTAMSRYYWSAELKRYIARHRFYIPEGQVDTKVHLEAPNLRDWIDRGLVVATPGECVDYECLYRDLDTDLRESKVLAITYDPAKAKDFEIRFGKRATIVPFIQKSANISPAAKGWEKAIVDGEIIDDNPVLKWMVSNAVNRMNPDSGSYFITKSATAKGRKRIDGVITSLMAHAVLANQVLIMSQPKPKMLDLSKITY